ncbi:MAG: 2Fe-2S iron-sulfur cluster-binding protein [Acidobacteriota bacterium]|nr:2Fe-2S iron-sulfur cluster-binding protein [Acidobacteriota bacterium]
MIRIFIDGRPVPAPEGATILEAAEANGILIPHFCRHASLRPVGSCRICLVAIEGLPKLEPACATAVRQDMKVATSTPPVREARRDVLELLLAEHPLDCPICDKAGECRLQDYAHEYGLTGGAFDEERRGRAKLVRIGPHLLLDRERCVLCTRCVRFLAEVTGTHELGLFERGNRTEVGLYEDQPVASIDAGNLVDLCPVGAITDNRFRFRTRCWFLEARPSICPFCARGCAVDADYHPGFARRAGTSGIYRIRPRVDPEVNGGWICDRGRYGCLDLNRDRLAGARRILAGGEEDWSWERAIGFLAERCRESAPTVLLSSRLTSEEMSLAGRLFRDGLGARRIAFLDPPRGEAEGLLLRPDRSANGLGADRLGFDRTADPVEAVRGASLLIILAADPAGAIGLAGREDVLASIRTKILIAPQKTGLERAMDLVLGSATVFEKGGTFIGEGGGMRAFEPVHPSRLDVRSEGWILAALAEALRADPPVFGGGR